MSAGSGRFVGRDVELSWLGECVLRARRGTPVTVVVQGEAGIGKSRLVTEAMDRLRDPKDVVALGHGVDLAGGELPYGTAAELLHTLVRDAGLDAVRSAAGEFATTLGSLYPPLGSGVVEVDRVRLLPAFHATIEALAGDRLVWVVVEDLHWVDAPTRDLFAYLVRVAGRGQLLTVVTVRSQDSGVNPAIADLVTTLAALDGVERTVLAPLGRAEVAALVADLTGTEPQDAQLTRIATLSQGNPLWTEQLLVAGVDPDDSAPQTIIAPILIRLRRLDQPTLWLLQVASLTDGQIPQRLLAAAYHSANDQPEGSFERAVESALAAGLLRFDPASSSYSFAHALLRQASESSISPPDRLAGHRRWAELLSASQHHGGDPRLRIAAAHHWASSGDDTGAFDAALDAAHIAARLGAWPEVARLRRRALDLFPRIPDAEHRSGLTRDQLLLHTLAALVRGGLTEEELSLLERELEHPDSVDPIRAHSLQQWQRALWSSTGSPTAAQGYDDYQLAREFLTAPPQPLLYYGMKSVGWWVRLGDPDLSYQVHKRALELAGRYGVSDQVLSATDSVVYHLQERGEFQEALRMLEPLVRSTTDPHDLLTVETTYANVLACSGRFAEATMVAARAVARVPDPGLEPFRWCNTEMLLLQLLVDTGRWDEAEDALSKLLRYPIRERNLAVTVTTRAGLFEVAKGDVSAARVRSDHAHNYPLDASVENDRMAQVDVVSLDVELAVASGDLLDARRRALAMLSDVRTHTLTDSWRVALTAARVEGDLGEHGPVGDRSVEAVAAIRAAVEALPRRGAYNQARHLHARADLDRGEGVDHPVAWAGVVEGWRVCGHVPQIGWALLRLAAATIRTQGGRNAAQEALTEAWTIAEELGAQPLRDAAIGLARRAHLTLGTTSNRRHTPSGPLARLTARELEVLRRMALGESNAELAAALVISPKTASVHVSRILNKLQVTSRAKATALAYQHGLMNTHPLT